MKSQTLRRGTASQVDQQTILVVDDEWTMRELLVGVIEQETAHQALAVSDAAQALEVVTVITPDLFILDYGLPGIDGLQLHDLLHATPGLDSVPTLMMSAFTPSRQAMHNRKITYLTKPFELDLLLSVLNTLLDQQQE